MTDYEDRINHVKLAIACEKDTITACQERIIRLENNLCLLKSLMRNEEKQEGYNSLYHNKRQGK
jgi:archaellum component FlaC